MWLYRSGKSWQDGGVSTQEPPQGPKAGVWIASTVALVLLVAFILVIKANIGSLSSNPGDQANSDQPGPNTTAGQTTGGQSAVQDNAAPQPGSTTQQNNTRPGTAPSETAAGSKPTTYTGTADLTGTWRGTYTQLTSQEMEVTFRGAAGSWVAAVKYERDQCEGRWKQTSGEGSYMAFVETMTKDREARCLPTIAIAAELKGDVLEVKMRGLGGGGATLKRK